MRDGGEAQLTDELGAVVEAVRPARPRGRGEGWERCDAERYRIQAWLTQDLRVVKIHGLLRAAAAWPLRGPLRRGQLPLAGPPAQNTKVRSEQQPTGFGDVHPPE